MANLTVSADIDSFMAAANAGSAKAVLALENLDNTSDVAKPVSTAQAAAIALKLNKASNLSDLANAGTARSNLGLGSAAVANTSDFLAGGILTTGLLCEYRFDEGSGTVVTDYSGNGNTGAYVGSPTFVEGGGFTSASGKYATGTTGALATAQTLYIAYEVPTAISNYNCVLGNSTGATNLEILGGPTAGNIVVANMYPAGTQAMDVIPKTQVVLCIEMDSTGAQNDRIFYDGIEVTSYASQNASGRNYRGGVPWFGNSSSGHRINGNIYYFASYSTRHTANQVARNSYIIREIMTRRGNPPAAFPNVTVTANQLIGFGDSLTAGAGGTPYLSQLSGLVDTYTITNLGISGITSLGYLPTVSGSTVRMFAPRAGKNIAVLWIGTNDNNANGAVPWSNIRATATEARKAGWKVILATIINRGGSAYTSGSTLNNEIRRNWRTVADEFADLAAEPLLGADTASNNLTIFSADKTHLTTAGYLLVANYVSAAIRRLGYEVHNLAPVSLFFVQSTSSPVTVTNTTTETSIVGAAATPSSRAQVIVGNTTSGSATISSMSYTGTLVVGQPVSGTGIPSGATIATIASTTSITISANATASGTATLLTFSGMGLKGYSWVPGKTLRIKQRGVISTDTTPGNLTRQVKFGSTVMATTGAQALPASLSNAAIDTDVEITCLSIGSSGTFVAAGRATIQTASGAVVLSMTSTTAVTLSTNADALIDVTDTFSSALATNTETSTHLTAEMLNPS